MNLATPINTRARKYFPWQYISLVCGLTLAAILGLNLGDLPSSPAPAAARTARTATSLYRPNNYPSGLVVTFYIARDDAQADALQVERMLVGVPEPHRSITILMARTAEESSRAQALIDDAMAAANFSDGRLAPRFEVIDLR